ncbi:hypothetical protein D1007_23870 [Hordeum vulgare]|nr:hypothetical protein D1007_23870 [Hordeum vulgare]
MWYVDDDVSLSLRMPLLDKRKTSVKTWKALLMKATMDSIFTTAFGMDLATLSGSDEGRCFAASFDDASEFILLHYVDAFWKVSRFPNVGAEAALRHRIKVVDEFV